jgi:hypothetical protein
MKKFLLLFLAASLMQSAVMAQIAELVDAPTSVSGTLDDTEISAHWEVINSTSETISYQAKREPVGMVPGSANYFCWGGLCYGPTTDVSSTSVLATIEPGQSDDSFTGYYNHNGNEGCTTMRYCFFDTENPDDEVCHEVVFAINCIVNVDEFAKVTGELGQVSPNPMTTTGKFTYSLNGRSGDSSVMIYNMVGELVKEIELNATNGLVVLDSNEFENGVYFYSLVSNNQVVSTKKMVVSH